MQIFRLKNGLTVVYDRRKTETVSIQTTVKVGSNNEEKDVFGISHFIEHMLFEGTKKRMSSKIISNEIESLGGQLNAYTSNERTCFFVKVPKNHFLKALDIISDITQNPIFDKKSLEKERKIILKEINLHKDEPRFHQWVLFQKTLFKNLPTKNPTYGSVKSVKSITRKDMLDYYNKYYLPNNIVLSIVGDVKNIKQNIKKYFNKFKAKRLPNINSISEPIQNKIEIKKEKRKILNSYMVLGYKTPARLDKDSYVLDVIRAILGKGQSGRIFDEIRNKRGLAYEVGVYHEPDNDYGFFAVYLNTHKKNISKSVKIILDEFKKLEDLTPKEIAEAKGYLEGQFILDNEDTHDRADEIGFWASIKDAKLFDRYLDEIRKVKKTDIIDVAKKYLGKNYALAVIEQI
ncbi:MAG: pitrilysin family protein [Nanoarchaeota archaeon]